MSTCLPGRSPVLLIALLLAAPFPPDAIAQARDASLVEQARAAAARDRNREAAELFRRAIEAEPARRREWLREYADQLTYSGQAGRASSLYRELLREARDEGERLLLLKGLGLALLWSDRPAEAAHVYAEVIRLAPEDADARRNHARAVAWSSRPREALAGLAPWLAAHPGDAEARRLAAEFHGWVGRQDLGLARLAGDMDPAAATLRSRLEAEVAPVTTLEASSSSQSDRLDIEQAALEHRHTWGDGAGMLGVRLERLGFTPRAGGRGVDVNRPMVLARARLADAWEINTRIGVDDTHVHGQRRYRSPVHATWLTWWPSDAWRVDTSVGRSPFDSLRALERGLSARTYGVSADATPNERMRGSLRYERAEISDGNARDRLQVQAEHRLSVPLGAWVGARWTHMRFAQLLDNGYFNPSRLDAPQVTFRLSPRQSDGGWDLSLDSAYGREYAEPGGSKPSWEFGLTAGARWAGDWHVQAGWRRFSTRTAGLSGFERSTGSLALLRRW